ncbi:hypothetical protein ACPOL_5383 [Acidisarcina polymorpha]|uniref:Uncharacterized protein n=1 Tax=Acidisarcina polymorpha TaxID=2211140 RepID=A0A2Z5G6A1_9BACT|nr:hypothetical protein [Acidisarcina polymorpha]AXC14631.1 hypothetical protein ACPOL_5383 [Acidisarcina polymorpha]
MAGLTDFGGNFEERFILGSMARSQYAAVVRMRAQMLVNSLRSTRGRFELGARIFGSAFLALVWLGIGVGCGAVAHEIASDRSLNYLPMLLWPVLIMWQTLPLMLASTQENVDFSVLRRFPVSFGSYSLLYLSFGIFDPSSLMGGIALFGIWIGLVTAQGSLALPAAVALGVFGLFNFLLTRMIFIWIERWLAKRRSKEILGMVMLFLFLGLQLLNPALHRGSQHAASMNRAELMTAANMVGRVQRLFPPGMTGSEIDLAAKRRMVPAGSLLAGVVAYSTAVGLLLGLRLRAEYCGESLGEAPEAVKKQRARGGSLIEAAGTNASWLAGPLAAILVKELRYLSRSGVMLFSLVAPMIVLFAASGSLGGESSLLLRYMFPMAVAYGFLPLTRLVCNSLGGEGAGIQLYFLAPTPFHTVVLAKNILHVGLFGLQLLLVGTMVVFRFGLPAGQLAFATLCWLLFALPANLAAGNILSITMAYRMTLTRMSREQGSVGNGLMSLLIQMAIFAVGVAVYLPLAILGHAGWSIPVLLALAVLAVLFWLRVLGNVDRMVQVRREALMTALVRAA